MFNLIKLIKLWFIYEKNDGYCGLVWVVLCILYIKMFLFNIVI